MRFLSVALVALFSSAPLSAAPLFLHLAGRAPGVSSHQVYGELTDRYLTPLEQAGPRILYSQISQAYGDGNFFLNLAVEGDEAFVGSYVREREGTLFRGVPAHFARVAEVRVAAELEAGVYVDGAEDPFEQRAQVAREFAFSSLRGWRDFSNAYGFALLNPRNAEMLGYVREFLGDEYEFLRFRDQVLSVSNMMAILPRVTLLLDGGLVVGPEFENTPFLPLRFFRNCFSAKFERGMCWKAPASSR
jgi:hypothetical protein